MSPFYTYNVWKINESKINKLPSQGLSGGAIAGIIVASTVALVDGFAIICLVIKKKRKNSLKSQND